MIISDYGYSDEYPQNISGHKEGRRTKKETDIVHRSG